MDSQQGSPPLAGVRVLDLATARGEIAGRVLADFGAEVIKVEPANGAEARSLPPFEARSGPGERRSLFWQVVGRGKRSVVLDIDAAADAARLRTLVAGADVLIESFDPGYLAARGLDFASLRELNPRLIYVSITPFGQTGPTASVPATDITIQAAGGLVSLQGDWDRRPIPIGEPYTAAYHAGAQAAADIIIALNERERSGLGQHLDVSMQSAIVWILMNATGFPPNEGCDPPGYGDDRGDGPVSAGAARLLRAGITTEIPNIWECADGYVSALILPTEQRADVLIATLRWAQELGLLGDDQDLLEVDWLAFLPNVEKGLLDPEPLGRAMAHFRTLFRSVTKRTVMERSIRDNLFFAPIYTTNDLLDDPHLAARGFWQAVEGTAHPGAFAHLSATPLCVAPPAESLGQSQSLLERQVAPPAGTRAPQATASLRPRPFEGLKVADFAWIGVGPLIAKAFADHGATVVHVESATRIDTLRMAPPFKDGVQDPDLSQFFANFNSSKLSLALNLAAADGRQVARKLIDWADVVVESFTPGTMAKLGLDYATVSRDRPDLVMLSTCLRGQTGPESQLAGYGNSGAALSGLHGLTGWPDRAPSGPWGAYTDFITPRLGVATLAAALYHRKRTGLGQHLDVSQVECGIYFLAPEVLDYTVNRTVATAAGDGSPLAFPQGIYAAAGKSRYVALAVSSPAQWHGLRSLIGQEFGDPALDEPSVRREHAERIDHALRAWLRDVDPDVAVQKLRDAGVPASVVARPSDLYNDAQLTHREFFTTLAHTRMGPTPYDGFVTRFSGMPSAPRAAAPCLGEHTDHVLTDFLRLPPDEQARLHSTGVLT